MTFEEQKELDRKTARTLVLDAAESLIEARKLYQKIGAETDKQAVRAALTSIAPIMAADG